MTSDGQEETSESLDDLFCEIWERESQPELSFPINGVGRVVQTQDLQGRRWEVNNFSNTVWEAAIWMHHFFQDARCFPAGWLRGRRVLELGAGTGLVGLSLALLGAEVTMTDLPEALPILRHNTEATFAALAGGSANDDDAAERIEACRRPTIRQLCWGDAVEAGEVAAAAAAAAAVEGEEQGEGEGSEWRGFDLIVGADIIYNEPTFPALVSTLSDTRLCTDKTLVYLATMLRGGLHEGLLDMLNGGGFHVRALDPASADDLRARIAGDGDGGDPNGSRTSGCSDSSGMAGAKSTGGGGRSRPWVGPEWRRRSPQEKRKIEIVQVHPAGDGSGSDSCYQVTNRDAAARGAAGSGSGRRSNECESVSGVGSGSGEDLARLSAPPTKAKGGAIRRLSAGTKADKREREGGGGSWGYNARGLGKILAFVARRRNGGGGDGGGRG